MLKEIEYYKNENHLLSFGRVYGGNRANHIVIALHRMSSAYMMYTHTHTLTHRQTHVHTGRLYAIVSDLVQ